MSRPTIEDVARLAGVSIATVSRCLHMPERVAASTRERVLAAVRQTGYTLNTAAQSLRQRRSNTVLVVVPDIGNTYFSAILGGIEQEATAAGLTMLIGDTGRSRAREEAYKRYLLNGRADGALLLVEPESDWFDFPARSGTGLRPIVALSEVGPRGGPVSVSIDNVAAAHAATCHLIGLGHRRIAHVLGPEGNILTAERREGYRRALREAGLSPDPALEFPGDFGLSGGAAAFARYAALAERPTAVFLANDEMAMGFLSAAFRAGVQVPRDLSVMGFDDIHFAQSCIPALSTIRQPRAAMGATAMRLLLEIIAGRSPAPVVLPFELVVRDSTAAAG